MPKNPFIDCKSRKRRKRTNISRPIYQGYCPHSMVRYNKTVSIPTPVWVCKLCLKCIMSENAVKEHLLVCNNKQPKQIEHKSIFTNVTDKVRYTCQYCNRDFSRQVVLKKHEETHIKRNVKQEWESESESESEGLSADW